MEKDSKDNKPCGINALSNTCVLCVDMYKVSALSSKLCDDYMYCPRIQSSNYEPMKIT